MGAFGNIAQHIAVGAGLAHLLIVKIDVEGLVGVGRRLVVACHTIGLRSESIRGSCRLTYIEVVELEHEGSLAGSIANIANGNLYLLLSVLGKVVLHKLPILLVVGSLVIALGKLNKVVGSRIVGLGCDVDNKLLNVLVGSHSVEREDVVGTDSNLRRDEPVVVRLARIGAYKTHILLAAVCAHCRIVVVPHRVYLQGIHYLCILENTTVGIVACKRSCH